MFENASINLQAINENVQNMLNTVTIMEKSNQKIWLLKAVSMIDLTTLAGDDSDSNVKRLCHKVQYFVINFSIVNSLTVIMNIFFIHRP